MKIVLLQDQVYLPTLGGGQKANRLLLEALARRGHQCHALAQALTTRAGPTTLAEFAIALAARGVSVRSPRDRVFSFRYRDVSVEATSFAKPADLRAHTAAFIERLAPDWIIVSDDKRRLLLECAVSYAPSRVVQVLQTIAHLPFGPLGGSSSRRQMRLMRRARGLIVISDFLRRYLAEHAGLSSTVVHLPAYGDGPFPSFDNAAQGAITIINPCAEKGLDIVLGLARRFPEQPFLAVPTWGADDATMRALMRAPNVDIQAPADDIDRILARTRMLLVPSLWPETFGYVVPEAMARGIPVLASNIGGLAEAKLGVDFLLPVKPARRVGGRYLTEAQDLGPWSTAVSELLTDRARYAQCARQSREVAERFLATARIDKFEDFLASL